MPTDERLAAFRSDYSGLTVDRRRRFRRAVEEFRADLASGTFRASLRVKKVSGFKDIWEMTFAPDGRATFHYGTPTPEFGSPVVWRRVGTHDIFGNP